MLLIIFNTYVSNLVDALELNTQNSPFSRYLFCILKIPDTDTSFPMRDCGKQNFSMESYFENNNFNISCLLLGIVYQYQFMKYA